MIVVGELKKNPSFVLAPSHSYPTYSPVSLLLLDYNLFIHY